MSADLIYLIARANDTAFRSWWPPFIILDNESTNQVYGEWNEWAEALYSARLAEIRSGSAKPRPVSKWRDFLKGHKESQSLIKQTETLAVNFLIKHRPELRTTLIKCNAEW